MPSSVVMICDIDDLENGEVGAWREMLHKMRKEYT